MIASCYVNSQIPVSLTVSRGIIPETPCCRLEVREHAAEQILQGRDLQEDSVLGLRTKKELMRFDADHFREPSAIVCQEFLRITRSQYALVHGTLQPAGLPPGVILSRPAGGAQGDAKDLF